MITFKCIFFQEKILVTFVCLCWLFFVLHFDLLTYFKLSSNSPRIFLINTLSSFTSLKYFILDMCMYVDKVLGLMYQVLDLFSSYSPNITLFISENSEKKLSITVWNIGLRHHNILSWNAECYWNYNNQAFTWGKSKESYYFSGYRMICYIKRFL